VNIQTGGATIMYHFGTGPEALAAGGATVIHNPKCPPLITSLSTKGISLKVHEEVTKLSFQMDEFLYPGKYTKREEFSIN